MEKRTINICDECNSKYYKDTSIMNNLCPNCSFYLYGYKNCNHKFKNGKCIKCLWNGNTSLYIEKIINQKQDI